jgi:hypothetical protein
MVREMRCAARARTLETTMRKTVAPVVVDDSAVGPRVMPNVIAFMMKSTAPRWPASRLLC